VFSEVSAVLPSFEDLLNYIAPLHCTSSMTDTQRRIHLVQCMVMDLNLGRLA
jgi:hypothetical protein